jgi:hypothetical protein
MGELPASKLLHERRQVWVHVEFTRYRRAYRKAFPDEAIDGKILSHALNRRMAALMGFSSDHTEFARLQFKQQFL